MPSPPATHRTGRYGIAGATLRTDIFVVVSSESDESSAATAHNPDDVNIDTGVAQAVSGRTLRGEFSEDMVSLTATTQSLLDVLRQGPQLYRAGYHLHLPVGLLILAQRLTGYVDIPPNVRQQGVIALHGHLSNQGHEIQRVIPAQSTIRRTHQGYDHRCDAVDANRKVHGGSIAGRVTDGAHNIRISNGNRRR